ncbi:MAG: GTPase Era [Epsilonproteobacteria bacterium]|nr:GTPase Era [Campylobacterota bacterium]
MEDTTNQKCGYVAVLGRPNAGKSSLLNHIAGEKVTMVSKKAQATRKRMNIIITHKNAQIIFVDTPGIHKKERMLNKFMLNEAIKAIGDSDLNLFLAPVTDSLDGYEEFLELTKDKDIPHILVLTKVDRVSQERVLKKIKEYQKYQDKFLALVPYSIKSEQSKERLLDLIAKNLPNHPWLFDSELLTTSHIRDIYRELIREAIFDNFSDEIPYESDVVIDAIDEGEKLDRVYATIIVEKEQQKGIVIGKRGEAIKRVGISARKKLEESAQKKIFLDLKVAVKKNWSKKRGFLEELGYIF